MRFLDRAEVAERFRGKSVAIVGSGPGCTQNAAGFVDSHQVVVRVNNYKLTAATGKRCDVHYSFYGGSIKKTAEELQRDGVKLCLNKCPDGKFMESPWHRAQGKENGVDFRYIYRGRKDWWFCDTWIPEMEEFLASFHLLGDHIPSTGFAALLFVRSCEPKSLFLTGFDFFSSRVHNVNEPWRPGNPDDPIGHAPERERAWLRANQDGITFDKRLAEIMAKGD